jgi:hypothetical protein
VAGYFIDVVALALSSDPGRIEPNQPRECWAARVGASNPFKFPVNVNGSAPCACGREGVGSFWNSCYSCRLPARVGASRTDGGGVPTW